MWARASTPATRSLRGRSCASSKRGASPVQASVPAALTPGLAPSPNADLGLTGCCRAVRDARVGVTTKRVAAALRSPSVKNLEAGATWAIVLAAVVSVCLLAIFTIAALGASLHCW